MLHVPPDALKHEPSSSAAHPPFGWDRRAIPLR
jgi:hypothetical protein